MEMWQKETAETKLNSMLFSDIAVTQADTGTAERRGRCVYTVLGQLRSEVSLGLCCLSWPRIWLLPSTPRLLVLRWSSAGLIRQLESFKRAPTTFRMQWTWMRSWHDSWIDCSLATRPGPLRLQHLWNRLQVSRWPSVKGTQRASSPWVDWHCARWRRL